MEQYKIQEILMEIICWSINENYSNSTLCEKLTDEAVVDVFYLAKKHSLAHLVARYVFKNKICVRPDIEAKLRKIDFVAVYKHEQMKYTYNQICSIFDEAKIPYIPLKGSVIRPYYPDDDMRTSCDIDILVREEDIESAMEALERNNYSFGKRNYHDVSLYSPNNIHLELHFSIKENMDSLDAVLKDAWKYAKPTEGSRYEFSKEFFAFHIFAHMAYHFISGGCGIRSLLDIRIMESRMGISYSCAKKLLEKAGIYTFASKMSKLAERCFSGAKMDAIDDLVLKYIFNGGVYGSLENHIAVDKIKRKSFVAYLFKRLFPPYKHMIIPYPFLKKAPYLIPVFWVIRWIKALFGGKSKRYAMEISYANNISDEKIAEAKEICSHLGF